ncbi:hypothetical protein MCOR27_008563 [Pyricularia oryzae]|uniref:3beta-hydroxysteroid 3-dehydrogenase n=2 Tax=Pyricularia TaxID=48558 RepID=A0ABQ8NAK6_PYRGI|nr:hypothetical protein MCOR01_004866 [Pyricularia oryzae]KAI6293980.1 hypothetical protein MCOR33_008782 [Pyricularia grisea]KAH9431609.1 hypothetical protein MCOR02_008899 [Pyricularia oryzae]KAI6255284.1 hypothetical protein MCOR19_008202 [Pyricularia oryzae]KAI6269578.1 hypothetical protein MCOR26_008654 [Pyricularia oryzae]
MLKGAIIVTGANGGLGSAIANKLLSEAQYAEYHMIFTVRNVEKANVLQEVIDSHRGKGISSSYDVVPLDLTSLASGRKLADDINARVAAGSIPPIRALVLNAGWQEWTTESFTKDGFEMAFQSNYLTHWLLTVKLLQSMDKNKGRIVVLGSWSHDPDHPGNNYQGFYKGEQWRQLHPKTEAVAKGTFSKPESLPAGGHGFRRYGAAKLCQIMMVYELQARLDADPALSNIAVLGIDPGAMPTPLTRRANPFFVLVGRAIFPILIFLSGLFSKNPEFRSSKKSAKDVMAAALSEDEPYGRSPKAVYYNGDEISTSSAESRDKRKGLELWRSSVEYTGLTEGETCLRNWR